MLRKLSTSLEKHFKVLNIKPGSNAEEIKSAYNKLVKLYHPDTTQISDKKVAADKFNQVHEAKNALLSSTVQKENTRSSETHSEEPHYQESVFKSYEDFKKHYEDRERYKKEEFNDKKNSNEKKSNSEWTSNPSNNENTEKFESNNYFVYAIISLILTGFYVFITQPRKRS
jgi:DnaJ family protein B protein 12